MTATLKPRPTPRILQATLSAKDSLLEIYVPGTKGMVLNLNNARKVRALLDEHLPAMERAAAILAPVQPA